jgi:hypothetical protein
MLHGAALVGDLLLLAFESFNSAMQRRFVVRSRVGQVDVGDKCFDVTAV